MEIKNISKSYKLAERIDHLPRSDAIITLKDHKDNFYTKHHAALLAQQKTNL